MGEVVEHAILHIIKLIFSFIGGQEAAFRSCKVPKSHSTICYFELFFCPPMGFAAFYLRRLTPPRTPFKKRSLKPKNIVFSSANEASYYGGIDRARHADSDALEIAFIF